MITTNETINLRRITSRRGKIRRQIFNYIRVHLVHCFFFEIRLILDLQHYDMPDQKQAYSSHVVQGILKYKALEPSDESLVVPNNGISKIFHK